MGADPLGRAMYDCQRGDRDGALVYRDGDDSEPHDVAGAYFTPPEAWSPDWKQQLETLDWPVLDIGCGPGKHASWLQERGSEVVAIDVSPAAVRAARARGLDNACLMGMFNLALARDRFHSVIAIGTQRGWPARSRPRVPLGPRRRDRRTRRRSRR